ncbi:nucleotidyltransferase domain-containing protein [Cytobacillus gottheilii]|uniref:nucleotidyltransferase domain-containing protein n=1 Tax=Cytobacillus gottheilii TaxID=859144 RepID=UPI003CF966B3
MRSEIIRYLNKIEEDNFVKIIYACESGSRVWGYSGSNSDYDVRFVYIHHPDYYLSIDPIGIGEKRDVMEQTPHHLLDFVGWDLTKALKMLRKSNPSFLEWLHSPTVYVEKFGTADEMRECTNTILSPHTCLFHYIKMAEGNLKNAVNRTDFHLKNWINILRPLLAAKWIEEKQTFPPLNVQLQLQELNLGDDLNQIGRKLLARDQEGFENKLSLFSDYAKQELSRLLTEAKKRTANPGNYTEDFNAIFRKTLKKAWKEEV